jgi:hypothetical protein
VNEVRRAPAPWKLEGDAHVALLWLPPAGEARVAEGITLRRGGLSILAFLRYHRSDVGPYDELLWLMPWGLRSGTWHRHTVRRIYVSSEASLENGRRNWGMPKELAHFDVQRLGRAAQGVRVTTPAGNVASFVIEPGRHALPITSRPLPEAVRRLAQVDEQRLLEFAPHVRGRVSRARLSELGADPERFVDVERARVLAAASMMGFELAVPAARVTRLPRG